MEPDDSNSSVFHIFDRLNSNGTPLQPQEMRAAIYHGAFQEMLGRLNDNHDWREVFGPKHRRAKDQELILRFFALHFSRYSYQKPMKGFLNKYMNENRFIDNDNRIKHERIFEQSISVARAALGNRAFRPVRTMNAAVFDAIMVAIAEDPMIDPDKLKYAYDDLVRNNEFMSMSTESTSDESNVIGRIDKAIGRMHDSA